MAAAASTAGASGDVFAPGIYRVDFFSQSLKVVFGGGLVLVLMLGGQPAGLRSSAWPEYPLFLVLSTLGMMMLVSATELLTLYVALELSAFPLYILVALNRESSLGSEAAAKYMVQGMAASALSIYGLSFVYGLSGTTLLAPLIERAPELSAQPLFLFGLGLLLAGFLFKLALFPFHFWAPDVYQAAPTTVVAFIATASKVATAGALCRLVLLIGGEDAGRLQTALLLCGVAAMTLGNLAALLQTDLKRLLGYSAVAHAGYLLVGLQAFSPAGSTAVLFYVLGYFAMSFLLFLVVAMIAPQPGPVPVAALAGLWKRSPFLGLCLLAGVFGLTGLPPTVGFIGKWFLFSAALEQGQFVLVLIAAANSAIAIYYYMQLIRQAYLLPAEEGAPELRPGLLPMAAGAVACGLVVWMGTMPNATWEVARGAVSALLVR